MAFTLQEVIPWGRSAEEYRRMFSLGPAEACGRVLGCGDGPASWNAEWTAAGGRAVSCDPLYLFSRDSIESRVEEVRHRVMAQTRAHAEQFVWRIFASPDELESARLAVASRFLEDYEEGGAEGRYVAAVLPQLPSQFETFSVALCSHFLFLYSGHLSLEFHLNAIREMLRVAQEVRVFPLLGLDALTSPHLTPVVEALSPYYAVAIETVDYEFQRGGNQMLRLWRREA